MAAMSQLKHLVACFFYLAGHPTYSERVVLGGTQWCIIVCVLCRPGSFGSYPSTIVRDDPIDGEPEDSEWRVDMEGDDLIWRMAQGLNLHRWGIIHK